MLTLQYNNEKHYLTNYPFTEGFLELVKVSGFPTAASKFAGGGI